MNCLHKPINHLPAHWHMHVHGGDNGKGAASAQKMRLVLDFHPLSGISLRSGLLFVNSCSGVRMGKNMAAHVHAEAESASSGAFPTSAGKIAVTSIMLPVRFAHRQLPVCDGLLMCQRGNVMTPNKLTVSV